MEPLFCAFLHTVKSWVWKNNFASTFLFGKNGETFQWTHPFLLPRYERIFDFWISNRKWTLILRLLGARHRSGFYTKPCVQKVWNKASRKGNEWTIFAPSRLCVRNSTLRFSCCWFEFSFASIGDSSSPSLPYQGGRHVLLLAVKPVCQIQTGQWVLGYCRVRRT